MEATIHNDGREVLQSALNPQGGIRTVEIDEEGRYWAALYHGETGDYQSGQIFETWGQANDNMISLMYSDCVHAGLIDA